MHRKHRKHSIPQFIGPDGKVELQESQLANLLIGQEKIRRAAAVKRHTIGRHLARGLSARDIAIVTGFSVASVYRHVAALGGPLEPRTVESRKSKAGALFAAGKSNAEVARALGLSRATVRFYRWELKPDPLLL